MSLNGLGRFRFGGADDPPDRLIAGDGLDVARGLPTGSLDLVYLDPPFGTGGPRTGRVGRYADAADDPDQLIGWLSPTLTEAHRALTASGSLMLHLDHRAVHYAKVALDRLFGRARFVNEIIWCYTVGGKGRRGFGRKHDTILWYARGPDHAFYPDAVRVARRAGSHMRVVRDEAGRAVQEKTDRKTGRVYRYPVDRGKVPEDWWTDIETLNHSDRERVGWPTQKPARLLERLLLATTRPGDQVADFFAGSGTTAAVAQRLGRRFVTADRSDQAVAVTQARLVAQGQELAQAGRPPPDLTVEMAARAAIGASRPER